jgi:hypothetical protein
VENLLHLRAIAENGDWEAYHQFRKNQGHVRLYGKPYPHQTPLELLVLDRDSCLNKQLTIATHRTVEPITSPETPDNYYELPLVV